MDKKIIEGAPDAIGPYCHAVRTGNLLYCSGQTPLDPESMKIIGDNIEEQTARVFDNLEIVLTGCGLGLKNIVKTNVYLRDMADFDGMNKIYAKKMGDHRPARTTIAVKQNPLDAMVEIECIAEIS